MLSETSRAREPALAPGDAVGLQSRQHLLAGSYKDAPLELHRKTIEVNLLGARSGAYAVLPIFMRQNRGIINVISTAKVGSENSANEVTIQANSHFSRFRGIKSVIRRAPEPYRYGGRHLIRMHNL